MKKFINRIIRARWTYRQSLTKKPKKIDTRISDLFVWRMSSEWETFFELIDIASLFESESKSIHHVDIILFDSSGEIILKKKVNLIKNKRQVVNICDILSKANHTKQYGEIGTFAIFHSKVPEIIPRLHSFIAERGYVSYRYKGLPLRSYVHGNLDAISIYEDSIDLVGGRGFLTRQYNLQYELKGPALYDLGIVNSSNKTLMVECNFISIVDGSTTKEQKSIESGGVKTFSIDVDSNCSFRAVISSKLVMTRPLIFRINKDHFDVFHG